jgi:hypothetical protein
LLTTHQNSKPQAAFSKLNAMRSGAIFLVAFSMAQAQSPVEKNLARPIGPAAWHRDIYRPSGPWAIQVVEFDLRHPFLQLETVKAGDQLYGKERTSAMAARLDGEKRRVVAAINGDFFDINHGVPINLQLRNGEVVRQPTGRSVFALSAAEKPVISFLSLVGSLQSESGFWQALSGFNRARNADELVFYNHYFGGSTGTNQFGSEVRIKPLKKFSVNDTIRAVVVETHRQVGNAQLEASTYVLSGHGAAENWLARNVALGDTIKFVWCIPETPWRLVEAVGGLPRLVRDGNISVESKAEGGSESFTNNRHPRTAIGFTADTSRFFFVTVDGRQPGYSEGMTLLELATFMRELGCGQALNLDGGGSTTMVVRGNVVNRPSDAAGERAVANALLLVCTAPPGKLAHLDITTSRASVQAGGKFDFNMIATDSLFNPLNLSDKEVFWKVPRKLGKIDKYGVFTAGAKIDSGYVVAYRQPARDSAWVVVRPAR